MGFLREEQRARKTAGEVGFEFGEAVAADFLELGGAAGELAQIRLVARRRHHQGAARFSDRDGAGPVDQRLHAEAGDQRFRRVQLAPGRDHAARVPGAAATRRLLALDDLDLRAASREFIGRRQAGDARSNNSDAHPRLLHIWVRATGGFGSRAKKGKGLPANAIPPPA